MEKMTITQAFKRSGLTVIYGDDRDYMWRVAYNGREYFIGEVDSNISWTTRYHVTDLQTGEKLCTRANYRAAMHLIKSKKEERA